MTITAPTPKVTRPPMSTQFSRYSRRSSTSSRKVLTASPGDSGITRDRGASNSHRRRLRCNCKACSFQCETHTRSPTQITRLRPIARIANTITGPQAVAATGWPRGEAVEDPADQNPEDQWRAVDQRPHHQAEAESATGGT